MTNNSSIAKEKNYDLKERTAVFAEEIIEFVKTVKRCEITRPIISQLIRSGTSIGANYAEADGAESRKDFVHKIALSNKEVKETKYWLRIIAKAEVEKRDRALELWKEADELNRIFSSILIKTKQGGSKAFEI